MRDYQVSTGKNFCKNEKIIELFLEKMKNAPTWGSISFNVILNAGIVKRIEVATNESMVWNSAQ